jgi:hypothetical protein
MNWFHRRVCRSARWRGRLKGLLPWALHGVDLGEDVLEIGPGPGVTASAIAASIALALWKGFPITTCEKTRTTGETVRASQLSRQTAPASQPHFVLQPVTR